MDEITIHQPGEIIPQRPINELLKEWERSLDERVRAQEISEDTKTGYVRGAIKFIFWSQGQDATPTTIRAWKAELLQAGTAPASVNAWLAGCRSFFSWLAELGEIKFDPTQSIKGAPRKGTKKRHRREALTDSEARAVLAKPEKSRDRAMIALMLYTAARTIELYHADLADLNTSGGKMVIYVQGKGSTEKDEMLVITGDAESAMREWLAERGQQPGPLFTSASDRSSGKRLSRRAIRGIIKGHFLAAGIHGNKTTHSLRHTAISNAIRHHVPAEKVRGMSRHASLDTLMIYYHEADRIADPAESHINYSDDLLR
jgi:site-specific recombinase XerD